MTTQNDKATTPISKRPKTDLLQLLQTIYQWRKVLIATFLVTAIGSAIISLVLPVYYEATTVFFAISPDQSKPEILYGTRSIAPELYGNENDIDRLLTISESDILVDYLVDSFQLFEHYDINPDSPRGRHYVRKRFRGFYDVMKTKRDALQLSIEDQDPERSAAIARAAREKINAMVTEVIKSAQQRTIQTFEEGIKAKEDKLAILTDTLQSLRKRYGIFNTESQSEGLTGKLSSVESKLVETQAKRDAFAENKRFRDSVALYDVRIAGLETQVEEINGKLNKFNEGVSQVIIYNRQYQGANNTLAIDKEKLKQYRTVYDTQTPGVLLVEEASVPLIKSRPHRSLLVVGSVAVAMLFALIGIFLFEAFRDTNWRSILQDR